MFHGVDRDGYLDYSRNLSGKELDLISEFKDWLPDNIIDCHAHCNLEEHVRSIDSRSFNHMLSTFPSFTLEESKSWHRLLHPGKHIRSLRFANVFSGIDHKAANLYLLEHSSREDRVALYGLPNDIEYTATMLSHQKVSALKMYYSYFNPPAQEIYQYFPKEVLEVAQDLDIPIVLHPPKNITLCLDQILRLVKDFPKLRICLAHLSLTKSVVLGLEEAFDVLSKLPNVFFDTSLVPSTEVVLMALKLVGSNRIMFGSDEPLNLIRSTPFLHPEKGERLATEFRYHWIDPYDFKEYRNLAVNLTHAHWQALRAIKNSVEEFPKGMQNSIKHQLFHDNAKMFYGF